MQSDQGAANRGERKQGVASRSLNICCSEACWTNHSGGGGENAIQPYSSSEFVRAVRQGASIVAFRAGSMAGTRIASCAQTGAQRVGRLGERTCGVFPGAWSLQQQTGNDRGHGLGQGTARDEYLPMKPLSEFLPRIKSHGQQGRDYESTPACWVRATGSCPRQCFIASSSPIPYSRKAPQCVRVVDGH